MIDGYSRLAAFVKVVLPQAATGIAATAIFCLIFAWNEYAFSVLLTSGYGADRPALHPDHHRRGRPGLARRRRRDDAVPAADPRLHRAAAQAPAARHHLRRGAQMSRAPAPPRPVGECRHRRHHAGRGDADAAAGAGAVHLELPGDPGRYRDVRRRQPFPGLIQHGPDPAEQCAQGVRRVRRRPRQQLHHRGRQLLRAAGPFGLRQDHDAADDRRARAADLGRDPPRRRGRHVQACPRARHRLRVPAVRALPAHERAPEHRLPALRPGRAPRRDPRAGSRRRQGSCVSTICSTGRSAGWPAATASAWRWAGPSSAARRRS